MDAPFDISLTTDDNEYLNKQLKKFREAEEKL